MSERAQILARIAESYVELSQARRALETCPASERLSIANHIKVVLDEIDRGQALTRANQSIAADGEARSVPPGSSRSGQPEAAFLPYVQKVTT